MATDPVARALATAHDCIGRLERDHRAVTANMAAGMVTVGGNTTSNDSEGAVAWTTVEAQGNLRIHTQAGHYQTLIERALANLLEADLLRGLNVTANTTPLVEQIRCDGGAGEWADPTCERNAVTPHSVWIEGTQHQLCQRCWDRYRQRKSRVGA